MKPISSLTAQLESIELI